MPYITEINKNALAASKLVQPVRISLGNDAEGSVDIDGTDNVTLNVYFKNSTSARYRLGLGSSAVLDTGTEAGNVPVLDNNGKLNVSTIPSLALTDVFVKTDIIGTTETAAHAALETWVISLNAQVGDIAIYTYTWSSPQAGTSSGTLIKSTEGRTFGAWTPIVVPAQAEIEVIKSKLDAHIGVGGTTCHPCANTSNAGFMPKLPTVAGETQFLAGDGTWKQVEACDNHTYMACSGMVAGQIMVIEDHVCVAKSSTVAYASGVVAYGSTQVPGQSVFVRNDGLKVIYGDLLEAEEGIYIHAGYVVDSTHIELGTNQTIYRIV